jgi:hypothetical protein
LDYNAAKDIKERIRTGLGANFKNIPRRSLIQPMTEFYIDRVIPVLPLLQKTNKNVQKLLPPLAATTLPKLYGGVEHNEYRY